MRNQLELLKLATDLEHLERTSASDAWRKAKVLCYVKSEDGKYLGKDGTWGSKEDRKIFQTPGAGIDAAASATSTGYHRFVYRDKDNKPADPRDR